MEQQLRDRIAAAIDGKLFPACVIGVVRKNGERIIAPVGTCTYEPNAPRVSEDTIFDVASITKVIPTSSLALQLIDEGKLGLDEPMIKYVPELANSDRERVLIRHLLTQTLQFTISMSKLKDKSIDEMMKIVLTTDFGSPPGTSYYYANPTSIFLGLVIERITGKKLDALAEERFFQPLGMTRTTFWPLKKFSKEEIVPTEIQEWRGGDGIVQGVVHDESTFLLQKIMCPGAAGLFSTVPDLLTFVEMLLDDGALRGQMFFSKKIMQQIETNQLKDIGAWSGLGWELNQQKFFGSFSNEHTFGKTGFTGCLLVIDRAKERGLVILSNHTYPKRPESRDAINAFRRDIADIVFGQIRSE